MRRLAAIAVALSVITVAPQAHADAALTVDVSAPAGRPINHELLGLAHEPRTFAVADLLATRVPRLSWMRVDTFFETPSDVELEDDGHVLLDPARIDGRLAKVEASEAEALLILDYMPPDMAEPTCAARSRFYPGAERCPPADYAQWKDLVRQAVRHACCGTNVVTGGPNSVRWFEVWNEPDLIHFFAGTLLDYLEIYRASNEALKEVETETGVDLHIGGGAFLFDNPVWIEGLLAFVAASRADGDPESDLDLDFLSWHHYANSPLLGPFETLRTTPDADSPLLNAGVYADQTEFVRDLVEPYRDLGIDPLLWLDEWNVNAGADTRHDTPYAAAFTTAVLHAMQEAGLDRSVRFNTQNNNDTPFETWGMFTFGGLPKPVFHAFQMWDRMEAERVTVDGLEAETSVDGGGPADRRFRFGVLASTSPDRDRITLLAYNFAPYRERERRTLSATVTGLDDSLAYTETLYVVDAEHVGIGDADLVAVRGPRVVELPGPLEDVVLEPNSVALVVLER